MEPNLGTTKEMGDSDKSLESLVTTQEPSRQQTLALALWTTAFGHAFQEYAAPYQTPAEHKRLEAQFAAAVRWACAKGPEQNVAPVAVTALLQTPAQNPYFAALWTAFTKPAVSDRPAGLSSTGSGSTSEHSLDATRSPDRHHFEEILRRTISELLAAPAGHDLCQSLIDESPDSERAWWVERVLLGDQSSWGKRHILGNIGGSVVQPYLPLVTMYVEPDVVLRGSANRRPEAVGTMVRAALAEHPVVVVSGEPGSGKSLTARTFAWQLAQKRLASHTLTAETKAPLLPLVISGRSTGGGAAFDLQRAAARSRWQTLSELGINGVRDTDPVLFPTSVPTLYLIDSADELAVGEQGASEFFANLRRQLPPGHRAVVFCRPQTLPEAALRKWQIPVLELRPFSTVGGSLGQVGQWLQRWNACSGRPPISAELLAADERLLTLAQTPMLLLMLAYAWEDRAALLAGWQKGRSDSPDTARWDQSSLLYEAFFRAVAARKFDGEHPQPPLIMDLDTSQKLSATLVERGLLADGERDPITATTLWLLARMAWETRCLEQEDKPKALTSWRISELLSDELEIDDLRTLETISDGLWRALRTDGLAVDISILLGQPWVREFLVGRCWGALLGAVLDPACSEQRRQGLTRVLRRGRLLTGTDRSFEFLRAQLRQWDAAAQTRLSNWAEHEFLDSHPEPTTAATRSEHRRHLRNTALALAADFAPGAGLHLGDATALRSLLASFWSAGQRAFLYLPRLQAKDAWLSKAPLTAAYLPQAELRGADLRGADLEAANLMNANLEGADLTGANLRGANLEGANLAHANLMQACLVDAYLVGAQLQEARLAGANLSRANLLGAKLSRASLAAAQLEEADLRRANLDGADLSRANLEGVQLGEAHLLGANLLRANLYRANLEAAQLAEAHLSHANLEEANLCRANLSRANLSGAHLGESHLWHANLEGADLSQASLEGAYLEGVNLVGAFLLHTNFARANLSAVHLEGAHLIGANLVGTQLTSAHLEGAHLDGAYLAGAHTQDAYLQGAHFGRANLSGVDLRQAHLYDSDTAPAQALGALVAGALDAVDDSEVTSQWRRTPGGQALLQAAPMSSPFPSAKSETGDIIIEVIEGYPELS